MDAVDIEIDAYMRIAARRRRLSDDALRAHLPRDAAAVRRRVRRGRGARACSPRASASACRTPTPATRRCCRRSCTGASAAGSSGSRARSAYYAERFATIPGWRCVLAWLLAETGRADEAREMLDGFAADDFRGLPLDGIWLGAVAYLAETAAVLGDATHAAALHDLLEPYADRNVAIGWASTCAGSASRHLGLLADLLGHRDEAIARLETALAMNERMRARPLGRPHAGRRSPACSRRRRRTASAPAELLDGGRCAEAPPSSGMPRARRARAVADPRRHGLRLRRGAPHAAVRRVELATAHACGRVALRQSACKQVPPISARRPPRSARACRRRSARSRTSPTTTAGRGRPAAPSCSRPWIHGAGSCASATPSG